MNPPGWKPSTWRVRASSRPYRSVTYVSGRSKRLPISLVEESSTSKLPFQVRDSRFFHSKPDMSVALQHPHGDGFGQGRMVSSHSPRDV